MTDRNAVPKGLFEELHALTAASLSGETTPEQRERLEALLEDPVAVDLYLDVMHETSTLLTWADYPGLIAGDTMSTVGPPWKRQADRPAARFSAPLEAVVAGRLIVARQRVGGRTRVED